MIHRSSVPLMLGWTFAVLSAVAVVLGPSALWAESPQAVRVGILGLDNYQGLAYAQLFNSPNAEDDLAGVRVVAAYPVGSDDYPDSASLIARWKATFARFGSAEKGGLKDYHPVEMVDSIEALLARCDAVMIASLDGRLHLEQAEPVLRAGKRLYITRPLAASLADAAAILNLARETGTPCFSSSQHRYSPGFIGMRNHPEVGKVLGCDVYGGFESNGPEADEFIRPLHSIETIYTIMGPGVESVICTSTPMAESFTLVWHDGRIGTYRGIKEGKVKYSATVFGDQGVSTAGIYGHGVPVQGVVPTTDKYMGYEGIAREMGKFFKGGPPPVAADETLEIFAVLEAAERSKAQQGATVRPADILKSLGLTARAADPPSFPLQAKRILFLGDSITHAGGYVAWIETQLRLQGVQPLPEIINIGLGSETCSGLSEPDHPFPRPDVHERLDRALAKVKPDVVVACYGMNDGIYHPFGEQRFQAYQEGVNRLIEKVHAAGAKLVLMTPPPFDPVPLREQGKLKPAGEEKYAYFAMYENYDDVLARYGQWVMQQQDRAEMVIDLHSPFMQYLNERRKKDPQFTLSPDGIHPNAEGHRLLGKIVLRAWGIESTVEPDVELLKLVTQRTALLHDAWLSEVGHQRPGIKPGLPLEQANAQAEQLEARIEPLVD